MYITTMSLEIRDARRARRQQKLIVFVFSILSAYLLGFATVLWFMGSFIG